MTEQLLARSIHRQLFSGPDINVFAILDGASVPHLLRSLHQHRPEHVCLWRGDLAADLAEVAPHLVRLEPDADFTRWLVEEGWGEHWGIFAAAETGLREMRLHFRRFVTVYDPDDRPVYFRFYDPRVLRSYLPTCNAEEIRALLGPVCFCAAEGEDPNVLLRFQANRGSLEKQEVVLVAA